MTLSELQSKLFAFRDARDWAQFHTPKNLALAISIESAELLEHFLWKNDTVPADLPRLKEELADVLLYCLLMAKALDVDPVSIMNEKIELNGKKYPVEKAKGNARKWSEL